MIIFRPQTLTKKVLTFMVKKGKNFSGNVTPLFDSMLVQPTEDEGEVLERPSESQPIPSPTPPKGSGGNHGEESISKQGRKAVKSSKGAPSVHTHTDWDAMDTDLEDYTLTQDEGTDKQCTDLQQMYYARLKIKFLGESDTLTVPTMTSTPTLIVFGDDETIAQVLVTMTEEEKKRLAEEEATKAAFTNEYDFIQARLNADKILTKKLQEEEREKFTIEERAKLLHDTIADQRRFLAQQRSEVKRSDENFIAIGFVEDERLIKDLNKKAAGIKKADSIKEESKEEEDKHYEDDSEKENDELRLCLSIVSDKDKEVDYEILNKKYPIIEWKSEYLGIKPQFDKTKDLEEIDLNVAK
ncbi:hypothetical protein Tco_0595940 [Tanacetum coccineum]